MPSSIKVFAPAKLNLALSVGAPDSTGFHPICSWMATVDLFDELHLTRLEVDRLSRYAILWHEEAKRCSDINWSITQDLTVKAHHALEAHVKKRLPVQMKLEKRIPIGGGLGGGSSDAAAMLRGLNELFELHIPAEELQAIARHIGSDVPFLVHGGAALVEGLGEKVHQQKHAALSAVLAFPDSPCPTARVYATLDEMRKADRSNSDLKSDTVQHLIRAGVEGKLQSEMLFNDLAAAAMRVSPQVQDHLDSFSTVAERQAHITGSGSTIFVLCDDPMHAAALAEHVERKLLLPAIAVQTCGIPDHATTN